MAQTTQTTVHLKLTGEMRSMLEEMAKADRRDKTDFLRLLIEDEWQRRNPSPAEGNGHQQ